MKYFNTGGPVIEIGSGHQPYPQSDVLVDKFLDESQRGGKIKTDGRPLIISDLTDLPLKDGKFSYSIASHVVEHVEHLEKALSELTRISRAGYIETPSALMEFVEPHRDYHLWYVKQENKNLIFIPKRKKSSFRQTVTWKLSEGNTGFRLFYHGNPSLFLSRLEWRNTIPYTIEKRPFHPDEYLIYTKQSALKFLINLTSKLVAVTQKYLVELSLAHRKRINVADVIRCARCMGDLQLETQRVYCPKCNGYIPGKVKFIIFPKNFSARNYKHSKQNFSGHCNGKRN